MGTHPGQPRRGAVLAGMGGGGGNDQSTVLLVHADGANASTAFSDASRNAYTITANGNAQISTAQSKFGGSSARFDGSADWLSVPDSPDWTFSGDFTIDCWVRFNTIPASNTSVFVSQRGAAGDEGWFFCITNATGALRFSWTTDGTTYSHLNPVWSPALATWHHVAIVRRANTLTIYANGVALNSATMTGSTFNSSAPLRIGCDNFTYNCLDGWLDEVRVSKGIARWTANFTPPTAPYY